jgi:hypothetical protein
MRSHPSLGQRRTALRSSYRRLSDALAVLLVNGEPLLVDGQQILVGNNGN